VWRIVWIRHEASLILSFVKLSSLIEQDFEGKRGIRLCGKLKYFR